MFDQLTPAPPDPILGLTEAFAEDPNPDKLNLTVGVYQDATGRTPILRCVKEAERRILDDEVSKSYLGIAGLAQYGEQVQQLLFGDRWAALHAASLQTPGGTGALRVSADFLRQRGARRVWCSKPTWVNHPKVFQAAGLEVETHAYLDGAGQGLDFAAMSQNLAEVPAGDVVCLHGCCHNPTGVDPTPGQWEELAQIAQRQGWLPLIDCAYQGFAKGLREDVAGPTCFLDAGLELMICSSFSHNFGLYNERVGALTIVAHTAESSAAALSHAKAAVRANYSNPPKHGAAIVSTVLSDEQLTDQWAEELGEMRDRIREMRQLFVASMKARLPEQDFSFINRQNGMFSFSGLTPVQVDQLRQQYAIYIVGSGRINVAGIRRETVDYLCDAIAEVCQ